MPVPTYDQFIDPLLRVLCAYPQGIRASDAFELAADRKGLTAADRQEILPSGLQHIYKNRIGWAHDRLKRAGFSSSPRKGFWQITDAGKTFAAANPEPLPAQFVTEIARSFVNISLRQLNANDSGSIMPIAVESDVTASPDDRLESAVAELRARTAGELIETLADVSPTFFETIVLDLLHKMGYGTDRTDLQRVGGSGDGGIDGIIHLDKLGLEKVYVQAKRWQQNVGRPEIQAFYGALAGKHARKGIFITTSGYTTDARTYANTVEGIVLIDGDRLAELMIDHEIGISRKAVYVPKVDSDYFGE
ncbi:MAG: restriction endonuclease [Acidobacteria bacterium]|nr:restriction endonuclease [Acidobacteriota bacterium]